MPPGSGARIGVDRDDDGVLDRDELDAGTDPADPHSTPAIVGPWPTVPARSLRLADATGPPAKPSRRRVSFKSTTSKLDALADRIVPPPSGSAGDPTVAGAVLSVYNAAGLTDDDVRVDLPASGWKIRAGSCQLSLPQRRSRRGRLERDREARRDLGAGRDGAGFAYTLDEPSQRAIAVRLTLGSGVRWCAEARAESGRETTASTASAVTVRRPRSAPPRP